VRIARRSAKDAEGILKPFAVAGNWNEVLADGCGLAEEGGELGLGRGQLGRLKTSKMFRLFGVVPRD
jgi:hypothetical protein